MSTTGRRGQPDGCGATFARGVGRDHPRWYGEQDSRFWNRRQTSGPTLRLRGAVAVLGERVTGDGINPAPAGLIPPLKPRWSTSGTAPRTSGDGPQNRAVRLLKEARSLAGCNLSQPRNRSQARDLPGTFTPVPGSFRRVRREGPDSAERHERAGQGLYCQHSMMFTARPPRAISLYFTLISAAIACGASCHWTEQGQWTRRNSAAQGDFPFGRSETVCRSRLFRIPARSGSVSCRPSWSVSASA